MNTNSNISNKVDKLEKLYAEHLGMSFPETDSDNELIHDRIGEIALYGGHVAGLVSSYLKNAEVNPHFVKTNDELEKHLNDIQVDTIEDEKDLEYMKAYKHKLDEMITLLSELIELV